MVYWKLVYPDGTEIAEPLDHASIKGQKPGAASLAVIDEEHVIDSIDLSGVFKPVFYRHYSQPQGEEKKHVFTVYGCVHDDGTRTLKAYTPEIVDAGEEHIDETMIAHLTS